MAPRTVFLGAGVRRSLSNLDKYGSAFEGASNIDLTIEPHVLAAAAATGTAPPQITPEPMPRKAGVSSGLVALLLAAVVLAGV